MIGVLRRALSVLLATCLLVCAVRAVAAPPQPSEQTQLSPELLAQGAGAIVGFGVYSLFIAPQATAAEGVAAILGSRVVALTLAATGAVAGTFAYDYWTDQPFDYAYFWHRGGFVGGIVAAIAAFGVLGYPIDGGATWLGWAANRVTLLGSGLLGSWAADRWYGTQAQGNPAR